MSLYNACIEEIGLQVTDDFLQLTHSLKVTMGANSKQIQSNLEKSGIAPRFYSPDGSSNLHCMFGKGFDPQISLPLEVRYAI